MQFFTIISMRFKYLKHPGINKLNFKTTIQLVGGKS